MASLQGECLSEEMSCHPSFLPLLTSAHPYVFDTLLGNGKELQVYTRRKKNTINLPPLVVASDSGNSSLHFESDDSIPIVFCKGKMFCTNHPISNFVSYHSLDLSYTSFVNSISSISIPSNMKETIFQISGGMSCGKIWQLLKGNGTWELFYFSMEK